MRLCRYQYEHVTGETNKGPDVCIDPDFDPQLKPKQMDSACCLLPGTRCWARWGSVGSGVRGGKGSVGCGVRGL